MSESPRTIGSLFSGVGGLEIGLTRAGFGPTLFQVEIDPFCRRVLARHWPEAQRFDDVRTVGAANLPPVDVICGGFPCQDVSVAGKGAGLKGARSGLWYEFARIITEMMPRAVVIENVAALRHRGLAVVVARLRDLGYRVAVCPVSAADLGAPHRRERLFVVGWRAEDMADPHGPRLERHGSASGVRPQEPMPAVERDQGVVDAAGERGLAGIRDHESGGDRNRRNPRSDGDNHGRGGGGNRRGATPQPGLGRGAARISCGLDLAGGGGIAPHVAAVRALYAGTWPAGPAEAPHEWEPPRTVEARGPHHNARLKALGNAVVPAVAHAVGLYLMEQLETT